MSRRAASPLAFVAALLLAGPAAGADDDREAAVERRRGVAVFAGGCFWCMEKPFEELEGVLSTVSGYTGGHVENPRYEDVTRGGTGHVEAVRVVYDPERVSYEALLEVFWRNVDPLDAGGQFCDRGDSYRSAVFVQDAAQRRAAVASKARVAASAGLDGPVVTPILDAGPFYPAEDYHQDYYRKNPARYAFYRYRCGRDARLEALWGTEKGDGTR